MAGTLAERLILPIASPLKVKAILPELADNPSTIVATSDDPEELVKVKLETAGLTITVV